MAPQIPLVKSECSPLGHTAHITLQRWYYLSPLSASSLYTGLSPFSGLILSITRSNTDLLRLCPVS